MRPGRRCQIVGTRAARGPPAATEVGLGTRKSLELRNTLGVGERIPTRSKWRLRTEENRSRPSSSWTPSGGSWTARREHTDQLRKAPQINKFEALVAQDKLDIRALEDSIRRVQGGSFKWKGSPCVPVLVLYSVSFQIEEGKI